MKVILKIIRTTVICLKRRNILVNVAVWVMFTFYWAFVNAKRIIRQGFESNVWSNFAYIVYSRKTFVCLSKASLNPNYFFARQQQFCINGKISTFLPMFFTFSHSSLCNSMVSWEKFSLKQMFLPFNFFTFFKIFALSL